MSAVGTINALTSLAGRYRQIRRFTEALTQPLSAEDCVVQSMPDASPTKWHLAHTTWFFETFVLAPLDDYELFNPSFAYLFNSYYNTVGEQFPRPQRGLVTRPGLKEVLAYREYVDKHLESLLLESGLDRDAARVVEIGLNHEQQHQELILTDIKHALSINPCLPAYLPECAAAAPRPSVEWLDFDEGLYAIGHNGQGFAYDIESPRHRVYLEPFSLRNGLVTCGEFAEFIADGGYRRSELWLSMGWNMVREQQWQAPLYWRTDGDAWRQFTLAGDRPVEDDSPVCHVSYFEADAFARWAGARLPTEAEWEAVAETLPFVGRFVDNHVELGVAMHPSAGAAGHDFFGETWQWTSSAYAAYPGYQPPDGALGEYNGKFMCNQFVLRGGSCATPHSHFRVTYRNFFPPDARWQFSGIRLCH